ncbi:hypothetical protein EX30DRAFT_343370 [Ascodesmis nigricans]|uniref:CENP-V/GFA domain-containing protein n=1 Tax=Ascodesmis nigricans TaxID=341454 RepID=A0A4S2MMM0_9PEZI|nr:hypothetical protein EX30DRAFT_343370 [Ascodesmis nigricans]
MPLRLLPSASRSHLTHTPTHIPGITMTTTTNPPSQHASTGSTTSLLAHGKDTMHENRLTRPPYLSDISGFRKVYDVSCFCGSVQYEIGAERPLDAKFCHCAMCQKLHGAPFQWVCCFSLPLAVHKLWPFPNSVFITTLPNPPSCGLFQLMAESEKSGSTRNGMGKRG